MVMDSDMCERSVEKLLNVENVCDGELPHRGRGSCGGLETLSSGSIRSRVWDDQGLTRRLAMGVMTS